MEGLLTTKRLDHSFQNMALGVMRQRLQPLVSGKRVLNGYTHPQRSASAPTRVAFESLFRIMLHTMARVEEAIATPKASPGFLRPAGRLPAHEHFGAERIVPARGLGARPHFLDKPAARMCVGRSWMPCSLSCGKVILCSATPWIGWVATSTISSGLVLGLTERGVKVQFTKEQLQFTGKHLPMANCS